MAAAAPKTTSPPGAGEARDRLVSPDISASVGSLGSAVVAISGGSPDVFEAITAACWDKFRKGWQDLKAGFAVFMAPSGPHALETNYATSLIFALANAMRIPVVSLRDRTVEVDGAKADPDDSFLIGDLAAHYLDIRQSQGHRAAVEWFESSNPPPDLVVEVEHTHHNAGKQDIYRNAGVSELWELATDNRNRAPRIIALDGDQGPFDMTESHVLPGVRPESIPDALRILDKVGGSHKFSTLIDRGEAIVQQFLDIATGLAKDDDNDSGGSPAGP